MFRKENNFLKQKVGRLTREVEDSSNQINLLESIKNKNINSNPNRNEETIHRMVRSMQQDWRQAVALLAEVEEEKAANLNKGFTSLRLEMSQKSRELDQREKNIKNRECQANQHETIARLLDRNS